MSNPQQPISVVLLTLAAVSCLTDAPRVGPPDAPEDDGGETTPAPEVEPDDFPDSGGDGDAFGPRTIPGRWYAGDFHVHATGASNDAGEESTPERIKEVAIERGLDFVVLTDHSNSTGSDTTTRDEDPALFNKGPDFPYWDRARELSDETFLMVDGNEISPVDDPVVNPTGHIGCYPRSLTTFNPNVAFVDRPRGTLTSAETVAQARDAGCFVTVNHPFVASFWMAFDWTTRDYDAMEVYNGGAGWDKFDYEGVLGWACDLALGKSVTAVGGSDNHRVNEEPFSGIGASPLGWPTTWVWSGVLEWPGIIASLDAGRVTIGDTSRPLEIDVYDDTGSWLGMAGTTVSAQDAGRVRVRGVLDTSEGEPRRLQIIRVARGACDDTRQEFVVRAPEPSIDVLLDQEISAESEFDHHIEADVAPGDIVFGWLHPGVPDVIGLHGAAVTNAVRID